MLSNYEIYMEEYIRKTYSLIDFEYMLPANSVRCGVSNLVLRPWISKTPIWGHLYILDKHDYIIVGIS